MEVTNSTNQFKGKSKKGKSKKHLKKRIKKLKKTIHRMKNSKSSNGNNNQTVSGTTLDFTKIMKITKKEIENFKNMKYEKQKELQNTLDGIEATDEDNKLISILEKLCSEQKYKISKKDLNKISSEKIMKQVKKHKYPCLHEYDDIVEVEGRSEWQNKMFKGSFNGQEVIIKTRKLKPMTIIEQKNLEKEIRLSQIASKKGLGPKIYDIFYCKDNYNRVNIYFIYQKVNSGSLGEWSEKNILTNKHKKQIKELINKLYKNNIIPGFIGDNNILVEQDLSKSGTDNIRFYYNDFKYASSMKDLIEQKKMDSTDSLDWLGNFNDDRINTIVASYLVKKKIIKAVFQK